MTEAPDVVDGQERATIVLSGAILLLGLVLQRFALPVGDFMVFVVGPLGIGLAAYGVWRGLFAFDRTRLCIFLAIAGWTLVGATTNALLPSYFGLSQSWPALIQFLGLTAFVTLTFAHPVEEGRFFRIITACFVVIACAGIFQFLAQFAGLDLFLLGDRLPERFLLEMPIWNTKIPIGDTSYFKSNGLFLLEPSIMSQFMSLALMVEMLYFRRPLQLSLFAVGLILSVSGTGWIMMCAFVANAVVQMGRRGLVIAAATILAGVVAFGMLGFILPEVLQSFLSRRDEFWIIDSSGHLRFVTPFWVLQEAVAKVPWTLFVGIGAGVPDRISVSYDFNLITPVKLIIEFGVPVLVLYVALMLAGRRTPGQATLLFPGLIMLLFTGTYIQIPPMLFPVWLIVTVANLRTQENRAPLAAGPPATRGRAAGPAGKAWYGSRQGAAEPGVPQ